MYRRFGFCVDEQWNQKRPRALLSEDYELPIFADFPNCSGVVWDASWINMYLGKPELVKLSCDEDMQTNKFDIRWCFKLVSDRGVKDGGVVEGCRRDT